MSKMATYNNVFVPTRFSSVDNAQKKDQKSTFRMFDGKVYRSVYAGDMRGKIKDFVEAYKIGFNSYGTDYNGYGYSNHHREYYLDAKSGKELLYLVDGKNHKEAKPKTFEQKREAWARRLVRLLSGCVGYEWVTIEAARDIADEKMAYKDQQIEKVENRQAVRYSVKRESLIRKMERENPLRYIEDTDHAMAIVQASHRHKKTNYEALLDHYREEAFCGEIDREEVKDLARTHYTEY